MGDISDSNVFVFHSAGMTFLGVAHIPKEIFPAKFQTERKHPNL